MSSAIAHLTSIFLQQAASTSTKAHDVEWNLKVMEVYMNWHNTFRTLNLLVLSWVFVKKVDVSHAVRFLFLLFVVLNIMGGIISMKAASALGPVAPDSLQDLILSGGQFNSYAEYGTAALWFACFVWYPFNSLWPFGLGPSSAK